MTTPLVGLVSGTYNRLALLRRMVETFRANIPTGFPYAITLVDGGSTDGTIEWALAQPDINLIQDGELKGAISAFTRGAYATDAKYILMSNDDVEFPPDVILRAFVHLENTPRCGAVAFRDNRPVPGYYDDQTFKTLKMPAVKHGQPQSVIYAQVGLFRKWLGDRPDVDWWGATTAMREARTYAGDNHLSAHIWRLGYTVDDIGVHVIDRVAEDELRQINRSVGKLGDESDSNVYYRQWNSKFNGPDIPLAPIVPQSDLPHIRVLYLPIYEPGWQVQKEQKRGLRDALAAAVTAKGYRFAVREVDYLSFPPEQLETELVKIAAEWQPRIFLTQIQSPKPLTDHILATLRSQHPHSSIINWNGDVARGGLISPEMLKLLRYVDLQLTVNTSVLPIYQEHHITADYWQIGYEEPGENLPDMPVHDVVWLASAYDKTRQAWGERLRTWAESDGFSLGLYGSGWNSGLPNTTYNFAAGKAIYSHAKISIGTNEYPTETGFVSNRLFQAIAAGGALYFQQHVPGLKDLTGLLPGTHYIEWKDEDDLRGMIRYFLDPANEDERRKIADAGARYVREFHSFGARVQELLKLIGKHLKPQQVIEGDGVYLRYIGKRTDQFGEMSRTREGVQYLYDPGKPLLVYREDVPYLVSKGYWEVETT